MHDVTCHHLTVTCGRAHDQATVGLHVDRKSLPHVILLDARLLDPDPSSEGARPRLDSDREGRQAARARAARARSARPRRGRPRRPASRSSAVIVTTSSSGSGGVQVTLTPIPTTTASFPERSGAVSASTPATLRSPMRRSFGHFSDGETPAASRHAAAAAAPTACVYRCKPSALSAWKSIETSSELARRRLPPAAQSAAARRLVVGHEGAPRRRSRPGCGDQIGVRRPGLVDALHDPGHRLPTYAPHADQDPDRRSRRDRRSRGLPCATSSASHRWRCTPSSTATRCTCASPTRRTRSAVRQRPSRTSTPKPSSPRSARAAPTECIPAMASSPRTPTSRVRSPSRGSRSSVRRPRRSRRWATRSRPDTPPSEHGSPGCPASASRSRHPTRCVRSARPTAGRWQ